MTLLRASQGVALIESSALSHCHRPHTSAATTNDDDDDEGAFSSKERFFLKKKGTVVLAWRFTYRGPEKRISEEESSIL